MIETVTYGNTRINFGTEKVKKFSQIFGVDSFNLLIGMNGSGKTTALTRTAALLAGEWTASESGSYSHTNGTIVDKPKKNDDNLYGVVYYSALPYQKSFKQSKSLIDASPSWSSQRQIASIELFRDIARKLNQPTRLRATVEYNHTEIARLFIPFLLKQPITLLDHSLQNELALLRNGPPIDLNFPFETDASRALDTFYGQFFKELAKALDDKHLYCRQITLAALQAMAASNQSVDNLLYYILDDLQIIKDNEVWSRSPQEYVHLRDTTLRYITDENGDLSDFTEWGETRLGFEITSHNKYQNILMSDTVIKLHWQNLSSGMLSLLDQFTRIESAVQNLHKQKIKNLVILIDEGDAFLHLEWQRRYIALLTDYLGSLRKKFDFECIQVMLASHSPILASDVPLCMVQNLDAADLDAKTFGAELDDIVLMSFKSNSIGQHAANIIRGLHRRAKSGELSDFDKSLIEEIGDQSIKNAIIAADTSRHDH